MCLRRRDKCLLILACATGLVRGGTTPPQLAEQIELEIQSLRLSTPKRIMELSCVEAIELAIENGFDVKISQRLTAQDQERLAAARARFDPYFRATANARKYRYPTVRILDTGLRVVSEVEVNPGIFRSAQAGLHGTLQTGATYSITAEGSREDTPRSAWFGINPRHTVLLNLTIRQPLLREGWLSYNLADIRIAENNVALARAGLEEEVADLVAAVETAYWNLTYAARKLRVQEEAYRETRTFLALTEQRYQAGYQASELDLVGAKAQVETRKYELINAHVELLAARDTLLGHVNPPGDRTFRGGRQGSPGQAFRIEEIAVEPTTAPSFVPIEVNIDKALETAFRRRPVFLSYELQERNQEIEVERRRNELWPRFDLVAEWNQHGLQDDLSGAWDELGTGRYYTWYVGAEFELPIFMRAERARVREAEEALRETSLQKRKFENTLVLEIVKAARDLRAAYWQVQTTRSAAEYATKQLEGEKKRLASGTSTSYTVLLMQNDLLDRKLAELEAVVKYKTAMVNLDRARGTLLSRYTIHVR